MPQSLSKTRQFTAPRLPWCSSGGCRCRHVCVRTFGEGSSRRFPLLFLPSISPYGGGLLLGTAGEGGQEGHAEALVHEAVNDGVHTGRGVGQQVDEGDGSPRETPVCGSRVEGSPGIDAKDGSPANEKQNHDHHQHTDDKLLGH